MTKTLLKKSDAENFITNFQILSQLNIANKHKRPSDAIVFFSHVPKTGGTTVESILAKNFILSDILHINAPDFNKKPDLLKLKKNYPKLICGHHPIHGQIYQALPSKPIFHFTQLRHPVDRVISFYNYLLHKKDHPLHLKASRKNFSDFIISDISPELSNGQAKRFSGFLHQDKTDDQALFKKAKRTLKTCFTQIFTTCFFDESLLLLSNQLNLNDIFYKKLNVSEKKIHKSMLTKQDIELVVSLNQADTKLYNWAKSRLSEQIEQQLTPQIIETFRTKNQQWNELINS